MAIDATKKTGKKTSHVVNFIVSMALTLYLHRFSIITRIIILNLEKAVQGIIPFFTFSITTGISR